MLTICLKPLKLNTKIKYGILSNKSIKQLDKIKFKYIKLTNNKKNKDLPINITGYCENKLVYLNNIIKKENVINNYEYDVSINNYEYDASINNYEYDVSINNYEYEASINNYYEGDGPIIIDNKFYHGIIVI
jgi:hypothetical protein